MRKPVFVALICLVVGCATASEPKPVVGEQALHPTADSISMLALKNLVSRSRRVDVPGLGTLQYTAPGSLYPYAWGWDAAVHAAGYAYFDIDRAIDELMASVGGQAANGMVPHISFYNHTPDKRYYPGPGVWQNRSRFDVPISGISQPPLMAIALDVILTRAEFSAGGTERRRDAFVKLYESALAYQSWWYEERDIYDTGVVVSTHPWETGMDNSGAWIEALSRVPLENVPPYERVDIKADGSNRDERPTDTFYDQATVLLAYQRDHGAYSFRENGAFVPERIANQSWQMGDVGINGILQRANYALVDVAKKLNITEDIPRLEGWIQKTAAGMQKLLWNEALGAFVSYDFRAKKQVQVITSGSFLAMYGRVASREQAVRMTRKLRDWRGDKVQYLVPSTSPDDPLFNPVKYWLGPVWPHVNLMIAEGLLDSDETEMAARVVADTLALLEQNGLKEYYHPLLDTGHEARGLGAGDFGFTSAVYPRLLDLAVRLGVRSYQPSATTYEALFRYVQESL